MPRGQCTFRQGDVTRAVKGVVAAGVQVMRVELDRAGRIVVIAGEPASVDQAKEVGEWDRI
jgi:hypothetical protein